MKIPCRYILAPAVMMALFHGYGIAQAPTAAAAPPAAASRSVQTASAIMQPSLDTVLRATGNLSPDHWKTSGAMRQETAANIDSIRRDLTNTLPPMLDAADRAPGSVAQMLPAYRNIDALYDVLLRVTETGRVAAPKDQAAVLVEALQELEGGRRALGERMQTAAVAREQHVHELEAAARAAAAAPKPVAAPCPATTTTHTTKRRARRHTAAKKSAAKPATTSTNSQTGTASH